VKAPKLVSAAYKRNKRTTEAEEAQAASNQAHAGIMKKNWERKPMFGDTDVHEATIVPSHSRFSSRASSGSPHIRRSIAAIAANRLVVPNIHMPVISEMDDTDAARLDALTTKGFARSMTKGSAASGMSSH